jgi:hypothetical protein
MHSKFTGFSASSIEIAKKKPMATEGENNSLRYNSGLAVVNPQQGHIIRMNSPEVHTCMNK